MTKAEAQLSRFMRWLGKHRHPRSCEFCDYAHIGYHDYINHLVEQHPEENVEFADWAGLR